MGHDISGYKPSDKSNEIAYLRRGAFNGLRHTIYNALDCHECGGDWSGYGVEKEFTKEQLQKGLLFIGDNPDYSPEKEFLEDCLANLEDNKIIIDFA